jgi:lysophospholipase
MFTIREYQGADGRALRYGLLAHPERPSTGRSLLYVPGLGGSVKGALEFLSALLPEFSPIYGPDLRGFGLNAQPEPQQALEPIERDLEAFYRQVIEPAGHPELALCGLSLGGALSTLMAARNPERFDRLILLAPAYKAHPKSFSLGYTLRSTLAHLIQGPRARTTLPYGLRELTRNEAVLNDPQYTQEPPLVLSPGFLLSARSVCGKAYAHTARLTVPTMMVIPGQDTICDPRAMQQAFQRIPGTTPKLCREYADCYHDVLMEEGASLEIAQDLLGWSPSSDSSAMASSSR